MGKWHLEKVEYVIFCDGTKRRLVNIRCNKEELSMLSIYIEISMANDKTVIHFTVKCIEKRGKRRLLERDNGKKVCYLVKKFPSSRKTYDRSKSFCDGKGGILVEIKGPKDQKNVVDMLKEVGDDDEVKYMTVG